MAGAYSQNRAGQEPCPTRLAGHCDWMKLLARNAAAGECQSAPIGLLGRGRTVCGKEATAGAYSQNRAGQEPCPTRLAGHCDWMKLLARNAAAGECQSAPIGLLGRGRTVCGKEATAGAYSQNRAGQEPCPTRLAGHCDWMKLLARNAAAGECQSAPIGLLGRGRAVCGKEATAGAYSQNRAGQEPCPTRLAGHCDWMKLLFRHAAAGECQAALVGLLGQGRVAGGRMRRLVIAEVQVGVAV